MSFNFNIQLSGLPDSGKKNLDIYFQPALTWTDSTVEAEQIQGIAMLFLENDVEAGTDGQDFRELVKILVRWIWAAYHGSETVAPTKAGLEEVYNTFVKEPLADTELYTFLQNNLVFRIREYTQTSELAATVFPMFPHLGLKVGAENTVPFSPSSKELDNTKILELQNFNQQFKPRFAAEENTPDTIVTNSFSAFIFVGFFRLLIRSGLQQLIDEALQVTIKDMLDDVTDEEYDNIAGMASTFLFNGYRLPPNIFSSSSPDQGLYEATGQQFPFENAKQTIAAVMSEPDEDGNVTEVTPARDVYTIKLEIVSNTSGVLPELQTPSGTPFADITYEIDIDAPTDSGEKILSLAQGLADDVDKNDFNISNPLAINLHKIQNLYFALRQSIVWQKTSADADQLIPLPTSLRTHLRQDDPDVDLRKWPSGNHLEEEILGNADFSWVSMIKFTVRRILDDKTQEFLPHTYELVEGSDDDLNRLEEVFNFLVGKDINTNHFDLHLAYAPGGSSDSIDLQSLEPATDADGNPLASILFCSNLSSNTDTALTVPFFASSKSNPNVAETDFLRLVWQGCTTANGGYFLHVEHQDSQLNAEWFAGADTAELHLIIEFMAGDDPIEPFHSAALVFDPVDLEADLLLARSLATIPVLVIPPGHIGINLIRPIPAESEEALAQAQNLYHMLGFGLGTSSDFVDAWSGMPIGPTLINWLGDLPPYNISEASLDVLEKTIAPTDPAELSDFQALMEEIRLLSLPGQKFDTLDQLDGTIEQGISVGQTAAYAEYKDRILDTSPQWQYERLLPAFSLRKPPLPDATSNTAINEKLPPRESDPYLGINDLASLPVECWWQDIYGNTLTSRKGSDNFPLRYTDPLIGLNQWPSVQEHFYFKKESGGEVELQLEFSFDPSPYPTPGAGGSKTEKEQKRLSADLLQYQKICYQLIQTDIELSVHNTVATNWTIDTADIGKDDIINFVASAYSYLADLDNGISSPPPTTLEIFIRADNAISLPTEFIFPVEVSFTIKRGIDQIHDDLTDDAVDDQGNTIKVIKTEHFSVLQDTARLNAKINASVSARDFAADFETAFPDLRLAVGDDRLKKKAGTDVGRPYYALQLGTTQGVSYNILEENPAYFALPPLANTLMAGTVAVDNYTLWKGDPTTDHSEEKQFEAIDLNVLARDFLVAIENFLEPKSMATARKLDVGAATNFTETILTHKSNLAGTISEMLDAILVIDQGTGDLAEAKAVLKQELLVNLVQGYDIETAVQFQVEVNIGNVTLTSGLIPDQPTPRMRGMAVVKNVWFGEIPTKLTLANKEDLDFSLSTGAIPLLQSTPTDKSPFTYLFDTKTPEKFAAIHLELEFQVTEIEYEIEQVPGISEFQASNWLSLVLPENLNIYQITEQLITDAETAISDQASDLTLLGQVLQKLANSPEKATEFLADANLQTAISNELTAAEYSQFEDLFKEYSQATYGITQVGMDRVFTEIDQEISEQTILLTLIQSLRDAQPPILDTEYPAMADFTAALQALVTATSSLNDLDTVAAVATIENRVLELYRIDPNLLNELDDLISNGQPADLQAVRDTLADSPIRELEFLSLSGFQTGIRKELGEATYDTFRNTLVDASVPVYRLDVAALDRLEALANTTHTNLSLFKTILLESKNGPIFEEEFISQQAFEAVVRTELGRLSYEKYKPQIDRYTQAFYQLTGGALDRLQAEYTGADPAGLAAIIQDLTNESALDIPFFTEAEFTTALITDIGQASFDAFGTDLLTYAKHVQPFYQMTKSRLDRLEKEYTGADPMGLRGMIQRLKAGSHLNSKFVTEQELITALLTGIGQMDLDAFGSDLLTYSNPYRITDSLLAGLAAETGMSEPDWYDLVIQDLCSDRLKDREFILQTDFVQALQESLGKRFFGRFRPQLQGFSQQPIYRMEGATLDGLSDQLSDDQAINDQARIIVDSLKGSTVQDHPFFSLQELEDAVKIFLGENSYSGFSSILEAYYMREVYRMSIPRLEALRQQHATNVATLLQYEQSLTQLQEADSPIGEYLISSALEEALKQYLELAPYENFLAQSSISTTRLSQGVFRFSEDMLELILTVGDPSTFDQVLVDGLHGQEYLEESTFLDAVEAAIGTDNLTKLESELIAADQGIVILSDNILEGLLADVTVQLQDLADLDAVLDILDTPPLKTDEFTRLDDLVDDNGLLVAPGLATAIATKVGSIDYQKYGTQLLAFVQPVFRIEGDMLTSLQADHSADLAQITEFQSLLTDFRTLNLLDTTHPSLTDLDNAIIAGQLTNYDIYKHLLLELADQDFQITTASLDRLEQEWADKHTELLPYDTALTNLAGLPANSTRDAEFISLEDLEIALDTELGATIDYDAYRGQLLKYALPIYRIEGDMLSALQQQQSSDRSIWTSFQTDLETLRAIPLADRTYTTQEELIDAFRNALSTNDFALQEQQVGLLQATLLAFTNPVYRLGTQWLADRQTEINTAKTSLEELGAALGHLHESNFEEQEFSTTEDFEAAIEAELEQVAAGTYQSIKNDLTSLIEPVHELFIPTDLDPSGTLAVADEEEFTNIRHILEGSDLPGVDFATRSDLEAEVKKILGDADFQLFRNVAPLFTNPNYMGKSPVPIPLRDYPTPPALIYQGAEVDESSRTDLEDIRQWEYTIIYEHEDIAQDSIDCIIELNTLDPDSLAVASRSGTPARDLFQALVNFNETYPKLAKDLALLQNDQLFDIGHEADLALATQALEFFQMQVAEVETAWGAWTAVVSIQQAASSDMHFEISEESISDDRITGFGRKEAYIYPRGPIVRSRLGGDDPEPLLALPGYQQEGDPVWSKDPDMKTYTFLEDPLDETFFGDSSIPDRKFTVENLDVIEHQNAMASIWLSRNKILIAGQETNPKFIFQTPAVSFTNRVSPFITNDEPWDLAILHSPDDQAENKPLLEHMELMIGLVAPDTSALSIDYEVRLSCRYAFSLAMGTGLNVDLQSTLPLLIGLRLNPTATTDSGENLLAVYPKMLTDEIKLWLQLNDPSTQNASLLFSVNLFSKLDPNSLTSLPMLRIKYLELKLANISG